MKMLLLRRLVLYQEVWAYRSTVKMLMSWCKTTEHSLPPVELVYIRNEQQMNLAEEQSSKDEEKAKERIPNASIKKICSKRDDVRSFVEKYHPHALVANRAANHFNDNVMSHFKNILQRRRKQQTLDKIFMNKKGRTLKRKIYLSRIDKE